MYPEQIKTWREACKQAIAGATVPAKTLREALMTQKKRNKALERELRRKDKALAETAALLTLRKKAAAIWGGRRGRMIGIPDRQEAVALINEAVDAGARRRSACEEIGITLRTFERWTRHGELAQDHRPLCMRPDPSNKLSEKERADILRTVNAPRFANLPPTQIVPMLADEGRYLASESSFYVYSRKIVAHEVHDVESAEYAAQLIEQAVLREGIPNGALIIHQDNGSPMKGSTYLAKLAELGIRPSYSRPGVSDDNAYAESLFRTCKYRPEFPGAFATLEEARAWMLRFTHWYNHEHKHRNLKFVSPAQRHRGEEKNIFAQRIAVYEHARTRHPGRWSKNIRNWSLPKEVWLNRPVEDNRLREVA